MKTSDDNKFACENVNENVSMSKCIRISTTHMLKMMMVDKIHNTHDCNADDNRSDDNGGDNTQ